MEELAKIRRVITKQMPEAPHETLMTVDATTGQNGLRQAKLFGEALEDLRPFDADAFSQALLR